MNFINYENKMHSSVFDFKINSKLLLTAAHVLSVNLCYSFFICKTETGFVLYNKYKWGNLDNENKWITAALIELILFVMAH